MTTLSILEQLISTPSYVDATNNEEAISTLIFSMLEPLKGSWNMSTQTVDGNRRNILVTNSPAPEILFTAHMDTVPPSPLWKRNPFIPFREGARLYGLGSVDMKAGLAAIIQTLRTNVTTKRPTAALFYCGEEYDFCGMKKFVETTTWKPNLVVNPEPTDLLVLRGCRGVLEANIIVEGTAAHAAMGGGANAIEITMQALADLKEVLARRPPTELGATTMNIAGIRGGLSMQADALVIRPNVVPAFADVTFELRLADETITFQEIEGLLRDHISRAGGKLIQSQCRFLVRPMRSPSTRSETDEQALSQFPAGDQTRCGYFDTQLFVEKTPSPCAIIGPGPSLNAHTADEFVDLRDLEQLETWMKSLLIEKMHY
ncbi:M20/M25/M40 family metallo-hydrolase [Candidatus Uhrbacteria bacterium]|nr:M20/M25/M40 family metallo-hydrolase [Candidatus Uhrbacteria bacterium]